MAHLPVDPAASPSEAYHRLIAEKRLRPDPAQEALLPRLDRLYTELKDYAPPARIQAKLIQLLPERFLKPAPIGLYLWGEVGRGKSMLMDLFFATAPLPKKKRTHFHAFIRDMHQQVHAWRQEQRKDGEGLSDPILPLARSLRDEFTLLCLDEFEVQDVADAMLLARLFTLLIKRGVVIVLTSNKPPEEQYKHGQQRDRYLAFVQHLKEHIEVHKLESPLDYRRLTLDAMEAKYYYPLHTASRAAFEEVFTGLTNDELREPRTLEVQGRKLTLAETCGRIAMLEFDAACRADLGANDYLAIAENFHTVFIRNIPVIPKEERNTARRFILLMDTLYDAGRDVLALADAPPDALFPIGPGFEGVLRCQSRLMSLGVQHF